MTPRALHSAKYGVLRGPQIQRSNDEEELPTISLREIVKSSQRRERWLAPSMPEKAASCDEAASRIPIPANGVRSSNTGSGLNLGKEITTCCFSFRLAVVRSSSFSVASVIRPILSRLDIPPITGLCAVSYPVRRSRMDHRTLATSNLHSEGPTRPLIQVWNPKSV